MSFVQYKVQICRKDYLIQNKRAKSAQNVCKNGFLAHKMECPSSIMHSKYYLCVNNANYNEKKNLGKENRSLF